MLNAIALEKKGISEELKTLKNRGQNKMINIGNIWHVMLCRYIKKIPVISRLTLDSLF